MLLAKRLIGKKLESGIEIDCPDDVSLMNCLGMNCPGPEDGQYDPSTDTGYYGFVEAADFILGDALAANISLAAGHAQFSDGGWLKFYVGPGASFNSGSSAYVVFIAKMNMRHSVSWDDINAVGAADGTATVGIGGLTYSSRLVTGDCVDSEWNGLMYRVHSTDGTWDEYSNAELAIANYNGRATWAFESRGLYRGRNSISDCTRLATDYATATTGWRPALVPALL